MAQQVRHDEVLDESDIPPMPPEYYSPAPRLMPVPQANGPQLNVPPPAPPSDSARIALPPLPTLLDDESSFEEDEIAETEESEFFPDSSPNLFPGESLPQRLQPESARTAQTQTDRLPVIIPAVPRLRPVSGEEPPLKPVPRLWREVK